MTGNKFSLGIPVIYWAYFNNILKEEIPDKNMSKDLEGGTNTEYLGYNK